MDATKLKQLLCQPEGVALEFKQRKYMVLKKESPDPKTREPETDEMIKDILSLANGNASSAGETAYLILGVANKQNLDGTRDVLGVTENFHPEKDLIDIVNAACHPPLVDLHCEAVKLEDGKTLIAITIPPSPHLHETTRDLGCPKKNYNEYIVLIRHNENVDIASAKEREEIQKAKQRYLEEIRTVSPQALAMWVGALIGGYTCALIIAAKYPDAPYPVLVRSLSFSVGALVYGSFGKMIGKMSKEFVEIRLNWRQFPKKQKILSAILMCTWGIAALYIVLVGIGVIN